MRVTTRVALPVVAAVVMLAGGAFAFAAIPDSTGVIHACYDNKNGSVRVVDTNAGGSCTSKETTLSWNQAGVPGPQGPPGTGSTVSVYVASNIFSGNGGEVSCSPGDFVTGGGIVSGSGGAITGSRPQDDVTPPGGHWDSWSGSAVTGPVEVWALCESIQ